MPGTNLTRDEAAERATLVTVDHYDVALDLTTSDTTFRSTTTVTFDSARPGEATFIDLIAPSVEAITLNGEQLDPATHFADGRITLPTTAERNTLTVDATAAYMNTGEGLHRFVDPVDQEVYLYSQFEVADARRMFAVFEQPDLKATFSFTVTAPDHWQVVSNSPTPEPVPVRDGVARWEFAPTPTMSCYITALVAGPYAVVRDEVQTRKGVVPLGIFCRKSLLDHLDADNVFDCTKRGFAFFEEEFDSEYPFEKYDQLFTPEYNMGAMENAGAVTINEIYIFRAKVTEALVERRALTLLHELAHMWFGNLVTMKWWNDLWLNESFAEWACYHAEALATSYDDAWTGFTNARKQTGYRADSLPSTHPIAADNVDLHAVEVNFDMITYAKGAAVLKQLVAWVGLEPFLAGLKQYFHDHEFANTEFTDLLTALEKASGRELSGWAQEWLQTAGTNTLSPAFELTAEGTYASFAIEQAAPAEHPTLRRHRVGIGFYNTVEGRLVRTDSVEVDVEGARTELSELVGKAQPELLLLNDQDLAFAKIRLDEHSRATAIARLSDLDDSLARALVWSAAWDMTRDAELSATEYVELVLGNIGSESDAWGVSRIPVYAAQAVALYSDPTTRDELATRWEQGLRALLAAAEPGTDHQLTFARSYAAAARSDAAVADLEGLLDGSLAFEGLAVDQDLRWALLTALARLGKADDARIDTELAGDNTISGQELSAAARAAMGTPEAKERAWTQALLDPSVPNETQRSVVYAFWQGGQEEVLAPYVERYLAEVAGTWERLGAHKASVALEFIFPRRVATQATLDTVDAWLAENAETVNPGAVRYVREGRADVARALAAQARDAQH